MITRTYKDKEHTCCDCGAAFVWNAGEQAFYASKCLNLPRRCPARTDRRRATINPDPSLGYRTNGQTYQR